MMDDILYEKNAALDEESLNKPPFLYYWHHEMHQNKYSFFFLFCFVCLVSFVFGLPRDLFFVS